MRRGQAMLETVLAALVVTSVFLVLFKLSHMLTGKILLEHAAMRVARARAVGMNRFMCDKAANISLIPVAGKRLWPAAEEDFDYGNELGRFANYLQAGDWAVARGILEYEGWNRLDCEPGDGTDSRVRMPVDTVVGAIELDGRAGVECHAPFYLEDYGQ